jgi:hypothetical protein
VDTPKIFSEIWKEAHRERSEYVWSIVARLMASPRRQAPQHQPDPDLDPEATGAKVDAAIPTTTP